MESINANQFTKIKVGLIRDGADAKQIKDGRKIIRAGTYAYVRLCPLSMRKTNDLINSLGSVLATQDVYFLPEFTSPEQRQIRATQALCLFNTEVESIQQLHQQKMRYWEDDRKK